jgi:hypothetical protein
MHTHTHTIKLQLNLFSCVQWCATQGECGRKSVDPHAGIGEGKYGWTHWDYCDPSKKGWTNKILWQAKHSAGQVTCLAEYFIKSDKASELRALDLLRQQVVDSRDSMLPAAEVASRYETCLRRAPDAATAVFCETDMLSHMQQSVVRHALLIAKARSIKVHWSNRKSPGNFCTRTHMKAYISNVCLSACVYGIPCTCLRSLTFLLFP